MATDREELEQQLREIITGCTAANGECTDCHCSGNAAIYRVMALIDAYTITLGLLPAELSPHELWTAEEVATYVGLKDANAGRSWLSRNKIKSCGTKEHPHSGRRLSIYSANRVRAAHIRSTP